MTWSPHVRRFALRASARICALLSSACYLASAAGIHLPIVLVKDIATPFPCMVSRCGCQNAEQCWKSCCCHTAAERLAWARSRNIVPPAELVIQAAEREHALASRQSAACCRSKTACTVAVRPSRSASRKHCEHSVCQSTPLGASVKCAVKDQGATHTRQGGERNEGLSIVDALKCHGAGSTWNGVIPAIPLAIDEWRPVEVCCGSNCVSHDSYSSLRRDVLLRPPIA
jgi:hypothetical protein